MRKVWSELLNRLQNVFNHESVDTGVPVKHGRGVLGEDIKNIPNCLLKH